MLVRKINRFQALQLLLPVGPTFLAVSCMYVRLMIKKLIQFYRVAQKNGATLSHCKYSENSITELRGNW